MQTNYFLIRKDLVISSKVICVRPLKEFSRALVYLTIE